jgi:hypothetical protein
MSAVDQHAPGWLANRLVLDSVVFDSGDSLYQYYVGHCQLVLFGMTTGHAYSVY